jgi:hypothetical protein
MRARKTPTSMLVFVYRGVRAVSRLYAVELLIRVRSAGGVRWAVGGRAVGGGVSGRLECCRAPLNQRWRMNWR